MHGVRFAGPRGPFRIDPKTGNVLRNVRVAGIEETGDPVGAVIEHTFPNVQDPPNGRAS